MRMIPKQEFTEELLNKYEITHVLSAETIDSMISRGFIPFTTNEVGDKIYNIDYYLENEDVFTAKLADFKNTRGYYTDSEFKKALVERDSSFESWAVNSFNLLAQRGLIRSDDIFEVQPKRVYLFSSSLIFNLESIKAALEELDTQLEAEEAEEITLLSDDVEIEDEISDETTEKASSQPEEEEVFEEYEDWEEDDKQARRKKKRKEQEKIARERRIKEEQQRAADISRTEAARIATVASEHKSEVNKSEPSNTGDNYSYYSGESKQTKTETADTKAAETVTYKESEKSESRSFETGRTETTRQEYIDEYRPAQSEKSHSEPYHFEHSETPVKHEAETYTSEYSTAASTEEYKAETKREDTSHDYHSSSSEYYSQRKTEENKPFDDSVSKSESYIEQKQSEAAHKSPTEDGKYYSSTSEKTTYQSNPDSRLESSIQTEHKSETKPELHTQSSSAQQDTYTVEQRREEAARVQYETERKQAQSENRQESKPQPRGEDGTFTFTGTSIGKETATEHSENVTHEETRRVESYQTTKEYRKEESSQKSEQTSEHKDKMYSGESYTAPKHEQTEGREGYRAEKHEEYRAPTYEERKTPERNVSAEQQNSREVETKTTNEQFHTFSQAETYKSSESYPEKSDSEKPAERHDTPKDQRQGSYSVESRATNESSYTSSQINTVESRETSFGKSDNEKASEKHNSYSVPTETSYTAQEKQYKEDVGVQKNQTSKKEREASSDYSEQKREIHTENGYEFTGTSIGKEKFNTEPFSEEKAKSPEGSQQRPTDSTKHSERSSYRTEQQNIEHDSIAEHYFAPKSGDTKPSDKSSSESYFDRASEQSTEYRKSAFSDSIGEKTESNSSSEKTPTIARDVESIQSTYSNRTSEQSTERKESIFSDSVGEKTESSSSFEKTPTATRDIDSTQSTYSEPYKINTPSADRSHITFEAQSKDSQDKQPSEYRKSAFSDNIEERAESSSSFEKTPTETRNVESTQPTYSDRASEQPTEHRKSVFSDSVGESNSSPEKASAVTKDVKSTQSTYSEPYKINVPLADGSYMTFEAQVKDSQDKQSSEKPTKTSRDNSTNGYDSYVTRAQAAYVSQGVVLSSEAINSIVAEVSNHAEGQGFKVSVFHPSSDGVFKENVVYDSQRKDSVGNIVDAYREASRVDILPMRTPEQEARDNKVLFAVGLKAGGSIKDDTYTPPAVPTIHPRVFDELQERGVKYVEVNGTKVNISDMSRISRTEFSVVENAASYVNETVAKEQIARATQFNYTPQIDIQQQNPAVGYVKDAEKIIVAAADTRTNFNRTFFIDSIKSAPEFVPAYLREVYTRETPKPETKLDDNVKTKTLNGFSSVRNLGSALDLRPNQSQAERNNTTGDSFATTVMPTMFRERKGSNDAAQRQADIRQIGVATAVLDYSSIKIDFTKPETVEECARVVEEFQPELAKSLRATSKAINGDIASVLAGEVDKVDGARLINRPETFIVGKAEYAEQIAAAIEDRHPENAARIRELSEELNGSASQLDTRKDIFRQFDIDGKTSEEMVIKAQELLQDPHSFKGHAREIEQIASVVEETRGDIAKQLRQASRAQNGDIADVYTRAIRFERQINNPTPIATGQYQNRNNPQGKAPMGKDPFQSSFDTTGRKAVVKPGVNPNIQKHNRFKRLTSENIRATSKMTTIESTDRFGKKIIDVIEFNSDGTCNITYGYNTRDAYTVYNYADGIKEFDTSAMESVAMKKTKLARMATRNRKLVGAQFMTSKNAHFALNNLWVKSERKARKIKHGKVNNMDDFTREIARNSERTYRQYQSGYNHPETWEELFDRHGFSGDGSVVKGLRGSELLKKQRRDALPKIANNIIWRAMPTQELNSTYLGTGYKYLLGRGSAIWTMGSIGAALDAKDRMRRLNRKVLTKELGETSFSFVGEGKRYSFRSGKDRRELAKRLEAMSKASMGVNITRFTTTSLQKMLQTGKDGSGKALSAEQLDMVQAALRLRGISEGSLSILSTYSYLQTHGLRPFDSNLSSKYKDILNGKKIEGLSKSEIAALLERDDLSAELRDALGWAQTLNGLTMDSKEGINAAIAAVDKAGLDVKFEDILKGRRISDLSQKQISILLKSDDTPDELKKLLRQTSTLRKLSDKRAKLKQTIGLLGQAARFWGRKAVMQFRGTNLGDGVYALYSAVHTTKTTIMVIEGLRNYNKIVKASLRDWISRGKVGSLRHKIANTKRFRRKEAKIARKQASARRRAQKRAARQQKKLAKKAKRKDKRNTRKQARRKKFNKRHPKASRRIKKVKSRTRKVANRLGRVGRGFGVVGRGVRKVVGTVLKPFKVVSGLINNIKGFLIKKFIIPFAAICVAFLLLITAIEIGINAVGILTSAVYSTIQFASEDREKETTGMDTEARLVDSTVELCINLDSAFKYYNEKFYTEKTVIKSVTNAIKNDDEHKEECKEYYDPVENDTLHLKRLGTTLNEIQTGIYYTYYNGDAKEIGFKSNSKDIASLANAWAEGDYHAKGLYKSYVEKLWNYTHVVAYAPRLQTSHNYVYACSSNEESSECYDNKYDYKCNDSAARVYDNNFLGKVTGVKTNIKNGSDHTSKKVNGSYSSNTGNLKTTYSIKNGIVEYNEHGCSTHKLTYHQGPESKKFNGIAATTVSLPRNLSTKITFYSNGNETTLTAPSGCTNWKYVTTAYKKGDGSTANCRAYYCAGCCSDCNETEAQQVTITTKKIATHTGSGLIDIEGKNYYKKGTVNSCAEKETKYHSGYTTTSQGKTYSHVLGTSSNGCNNTGSFVVSSTSSSTTYCSTGYCQKTTKKQTCNYKISLSGITYDNKQYYGIIITNPLHGKNITVRGETHWAYQANGLKIQVYAAAPSGWTVSKTKTIDFKSCKDNLYYASTTIDGIEYVWDIKLPTSNLNKVYDSEELLCYKATCNGHTTSTTTNTTYYYCLGHERCKGYLKDNSAKITVNYCEGYCDGHTLEHYCTGHVDLNVAVVTLFLDDNNSMAYLGVPEKVTVEEKEVKVQDEMSAGDENASEYETTREVQTAPEEATYLYNNAFDTLLFEEFDYKKYPLPRMDVLADFTIDLKGESVSDPGNVGNPLDTLRWNESFITDTVKADENDRKTLNSVISSLFSTFSMEDKWEDKNDFVAGTNVNAFNIAGSYSKFTKHHYFTGFFKYSDSVTYDFNGNQQRRLVMHKNADGTETPVDNGPYASATEALKEDWYEAYSIVFPGAYNALIDDKEIEKILANMTACASGAEYSSYVSDNIGKAKELLQTMGSTTSDSGIEFAAAWFKAFYYNVKPDGPKLGQIETAISNSASGTNQTDIGKMFRKSLNVQSLSVENSGDQEKINNAIKNLHVGDLLGAGDEVYVVLYNDTNARTYPNGTNEEKRGIAKGHVIVATVSGAKRDPNRSDLDSIHMFSFTTEYISKKPELFWVYKCE